MTMTTTRLITAREQAEMLLPWREAGTYYHRSTQPIGDQGRMPHTYFYQAEDPHDADYETRAYGGHVYQSDIDDSLMEPDPNQRHNPGGSPWFRTDPTNVGEMTHIHDPDAPFGVPHRKRQGSSMPVTLYSKPECPQCVMTKKRLDAEGIEHRVVDLTADPEAYKHVTENLGYSSAPVVEHANGHWSGFRPDMIKALAG